MKDFIGLLDILQVPLKIIQDVVSLVTFPPVNTNYFVVPFTDLHLINFVLSCPFFQAICQLSCLNTSLFTKSVHIFCTVSNSG